MSSLKKQIPPASGLRLINNGCVVLVSALWGDRDNVMTVAWQTPVSHDPPLIGVAISPKRFTHHLIQKSRSFAVHIPPAGMVEQVFLAGKLSGGETDKFARLGLSSSPARRIEGRLLDQCLGSLECRLEKRVTTGDHSLFVGRIVRAVVDAGAFDEMWLLVDPERSTIHHLGGDFYCRAGKRESVSNH